jgi:GNAT superfamily N-acetyltransferase
VLIRRALPTDLNACLNLDHSVVTEHAWRMEEQERDEAVTVTFRPVHLPRPVRVAYPRQGEELAAGWERCDVFLVASNGGQLCGYVTARALPGHGLAWVQDLVSGPAWRRQGLGSQLLREAAAWASDQGLQRLVVEVQTRNHPGVCFCRALGLSLSGYHDRHWQTQDIALLFGRDLR